MSCKFGDNLYEISKPIKKKKKKKKKKEKKIFFYIYIYISIAEIFTQHA